MAGGEVNETSAAPSATTPPDPIWERAERVSKVAALISVVVGALAGTYGLFETLEHSRVEERNTRLQSLTPIRAFIDEDFKVQRTISEFDYSQLGVLETQAAAEPARNVYFRDAMLIATIGEHYERVGAEIKLNYLDFDLVFEVVPFPDDFWDRTRKLRAILRANWNGKGGDPLPDLWSNFQYLCRIYRKKRDPDPKHPERTDVGGCEK